jgi:hypothetical protein
MRRSTADAIDLYVAKGVDPGGFLTAVLENNLVESFSRADSYNTDSMPNIVRYIYNHIPNTCWGSKEIVETWMGHKGLSGIKPPRKEYRKRNEGSKSKRAS